MVGSGQYLEERAAARARRELSLLSERAPRVARRVDGDEVRQVPVEQVRVGDRLVVASGDIVPTDGRLFDAGTFDESALTGEALPVHRAAGELVRSGVINVGDSTSMIATAAAEASTYAGVIRLVDQAQTGAAPFVRLADRLAFWFVPWLWRSLVLRGGTTIRPWRRSPYWWSPPRAHCCSQCLSRSSVGSRGAPSEEWS